MFPLCERLKIARRVRGLTQEEAAGLLGFHRHSLIRWEAGEALHPVHRRIVEEAADRWLREAARMAPPERHQGFSAREERRTVVRSGGS